MSRDTQETTKQTPTEISYFPADALQETASNQRQQRSEVAQEMKQMLSLVRKGATPELAAVSMVYFVQGFVFLSNLAVSYFLKDNLMQGPAQVAFLEGFGVIPWVIKPVYGFASDTFPLFGYRRRSYLILCGLLGSSAWSLLGTTVMTPFATVAMLLMSSLGTACSDVVVDSIVVERARGEPQETSGSLQSLCWASFALGGIVSSYSGGYFVENYGPRFVFRLIAIFPLLVALSAFLVNEESVSSKRSSEETKRLVSTNKPIEDGNGLPATLKSQARTLWNAFRQRSVYLPALFIFVYNATPSSQSSMFFFETNELHFSPEFMGRVTLIGQIAHLLGVGVYRFFLRSMPLKKVFTWSCILSTVIGMSQLILISRLNTQIGLSDKLFVLGDATILQVISQVTFMPVLVLAARLCPEGIEATLFALLMSINNGGSLVGGLLGAGLTEVLGITDHDFTNLGFLTTICVFSNLLPLFLIHLLPDETQAAEHRTL